MARAHFKRQTQHNSVCRKVIGMLVGCFILAGHALASDADMAERTRACTHCHGEQGKAGPDGYYPRLAGKPAGYLYNQLQNFKQRRRHYDLMTRLIDPLSDDYLRNMADYFSGLKVPYPAPSLQTESVSAEVLAQLKALQSGKLSVTPLIVAPRALDVPGVQVIVDAQGWMAKRYDGKTGTTYLLRPDQHVAARWRQLNVAQVQQAVAQATANV